AGLGIESYDPTTNDVLIGGRGSVPKGKRVGYSQKLFGPRVGFAYQMGYSQAVRGVDCITYHFDALAAHLFRRCDPPVVTAGFLGVNGFQPVPTVPNNVAKGALHRSLGRRVGIIPICCPDISKGRIPLPSEDEMGSRVANRELHRGYIQSWNLIIEHKLPGDF